MKLNFECPERYFEAIQKSRELNDTTLLECFSRLVVYIAPKQWQIEEMEKASDKAYGEYRKALELHQHFTKTGANELRALRNEWRYWDKFLAVSRKLGELKSGGDSEIVIYKDCTPLSFYFCEVDETKEYPYNGGIIFHKDHWEIHT